MRINKHKIGVLKTIENKAQRRKKYDFFHHVCDFYCLTDSRIPTDDVSKNKRSFGGLEKNLSGDEGANGYGPKV